MEFHVSSKPGKFAYVYALVSADRSVIKLGKARNKGYFANRVAANRKHFLFDLSESFCFRFANENQAIYAEQSLLLCLNHWQKDFDEAFPGHTEYLVGASLNDIMRTMLNQGFDGFISMEHLLDELRIEDYELPTVTIHALP